MSVRQHRKTLGTGFTLSCTTIRRPLASRIAAPTRHHHARTDIAVQIRIIVIRAAAQAFAIVADCNRSGRQSYSRHTVCRPHHTRKRHVLFDGLRSLIGNFAVRRRQSEARHRLLCESSERKLFTMQTLRSRTQHQRMIERKAHQEFLHADTPVNQSISIPPPRRTPLRYSAGRAIRAQTDNFRAE